MSRPAVASPGGPSGSPTEGIHERRERGLVILSRADGVRTRLGVDGRPADLGVSTTGVAGPDPQGGRPVGTVFVGISSERGTRAVALQLVGDREAIRRATVVRAVSELAAELGITTV